MVHELGSDGQPVHGKRSINEDEAAVIRRIFTEYASGKSPRQIAAELNTDGIPPRAEVNGTPPRSTGIVGAATAYCRTNFIEVSSSTIGFGW